MRSLAVFLAVFSALPVALIFPFVGVLLWAWIAFMNPHREAFGFAYDYPFNYYIALVTIAAWIFSTEPKRIPNQLLTGLFLLFGVLISVTTYFAYDHASAYELWSKHIRTIALVFVVIGLTTSKSRIQALLWVLVLSIGYFAVKGGGFLIATGNIGARIFGPPDSMITDNNELSLAIIMTIPLLNHLRVSSENAWVKWTCSLVIVFSVIAVVGTYSRGGFLGLIVIGIAFLFMARRKLPAIVAVVVFTVAIATLAPPEWFKRISSIQDYQQDFSVQGRFQAWDASWKIAADRPFLGGGFSAVEQEKVYRRYDARKEEEESRAAHSIWFQVLGDHGFSGLVVYLMMLGAAFYNLMNVLALSRGRQELGWATSLARMMIVSFGGYLAAGSLLSMAYYDAFLCLLAVTVALREVVRKAVASEPYSDYSTVPALVHALSGTAASPPRDHNG